MSPLSAQLLICVIVKIEAWAGKTVQERIKEELPVVSGETSELGLRERM